MTRASSSTGPTDIAWLPDGTFFISDGYGGKRVAKFDKDGKFLMDWGTEPKDPKNPGPNEWNTVHSIAISKDRRIFVADRGHHRMQVFDENGKFLDMFTTGQRSLAVLPHHHGRPDLWVSDGGTQRFLKYDLNGNYKYGWGGPGQGAGQFDGPHQFIGRPGGQPLRRRGLQRPHREVQAEGGRRPRAKVVGQEAALQGSGQLRQSGIEADVRP